MLGILKKSTRSKGFKWLDLRFLSTEFELAEKTNEKITKQRRFAKPQSVRKLKPFPENFINNLFIGVFDKEIFNYPSVLQNEEVDAVLRHSVEVENYLNSSIKANSEIAKDLVKGLAKVELFGLSVPQKYGGLGYTETETKFIQECTGVNQKIGRLLCQNEDNVVKLLTLFGSEEQKQKYLPRLANGEIFGTLAFLEKTPLIDLTSFAAISIENKSKGGYIINGKKKWVQNGNIADLIIVLTKCSSIQEEDIIKSGYNLFITEKNSPGITVHKPNSSRAQEFGLYEVDFENVFVPSSNLIGPDNCAYSALKTGLSHSQLSSAVLCLSLIKKMIYSLVQFSLKNEIASKALDQLEVVQSNMGLLTALAYALESTVYCIAGRFDSYEEPDLFIESCIAKVFAVEMLQKAIHIYTQIIGFNSFKSCGLLDEAIKVWQYNSALDENNMYLKLVIGSSGIIYAASPLAEKIKKLRQAHNYPKDTFKWLIRTEDKKISTSKSKHNLKMDLHATLSPKADLLETNLAKLEVAVEELLYQFGNGIMEQETTIVRLGEMATYIYAFTTCLARASKSYCNDLPQCERDINVTHAFGDFAHSEIEHLYMLLTKFISSDNLYKKIGESTFNNKGYPVEHPLVRVY